MSRIILILDTDLNKDHFHKQNSANVGNKTRRTLYSECIDMIFLTFREIKIVKTNLIEFSFCRSLFAEKQDQTAIKEVIKSPMRSAPGGKK